MVHQPKWPGCLLFAFLALLPATSNAAVDATKVTFADLAEFKVDVANDKTVTLCQPLQQLRDHWVEIRGYMLPVRLEGGRATQFFILRNQMACCFGVPPTAQEYLLAEAPGAGLPVSMDVPVTIRGRLKVDPVIEDGNLIQLYDLEDASVSGT